MWSTVIIKWSSIIKKNMEVYFYNFEVRILDHQNIKNLSKIWRQNVTTNFNITNLTKTVMLKYLKQQYLLSCTIGRLTNIGH